MARTDQHFPSIPSEDGPEQAPGGDRALRVWVLSAPIAGMVNQGFGLANAIAALRPGTEIVQKRIRLTQPWRLATPFLLKPALSVLDRESDTLVPQPPHLWPDVVIGTGRQSIAPALALREEARRNGRTLRLIQIQRPTAWASHFDVIVPPSHDRVEAANAVPIIGAPHGVTPARLAEAHSQTQAALADLPSRRCAVIIGGSSKTHTLTDRVLNRLIEQLNGLLSDNGLGLMVSVSRRTGEPATNRLKAGLASPQTAFWDGLTLKVGGIVQSAQNPYLGYLAHADSLIVTGDSVNMACEAAATGKPVHIVQLEGGSSKFERFHGDLAARGCTRPFTGTLDDWAYEPLMETPRAAQEILARLKL